MVIPEFNEIFVPLLPLNTVDPAVVELSLLQLKFCFAEPLSEGYHADFA
jgi:hypothetical protein